MIKIALVIVVLVVSIMFFIDKNINTDENQKNLQTVMVEDDNLHNKYGLIKNFTVKKVGRSSVGAQNGDYEYYDYYNIYVSGEKQSGMVVIKFFKNKQGDILRYTIKL